MRGWAWERDGVRALVIFIATFTCLWSAAGASAQVVPQEVEPEDKPITAELGKDDTPEPSTSVSVSTVDGMVMRPRSDLLGIIEHKPRERNYWSTRLRFGFSANAGNTEQVTINAF